jgi:hypothetical protein
MANYVIGATGAAGNSANLLANNVYTDLNSPTLWLPYQGTPTYNVPQVICSTINGIVPAGGATGTNSFTGATGSTGSTGPTGPSSSGVQGPQGQAAPNSLFNYPSAYFAPTKVPAGTNIALATGLPGANGVRYLLTLNGILTYNATSTGPQDFFQINVTPGTGAQSKNFSYTAQSPIVNINTPNSTVFPQPIFYINMALIYSGNALGASLNANFVYNFGNPQLYTLQIFNVSVQTI